MTFASQLPNRSPFPPPWTSITAPPPAPYEDSPLTLLRDPSFESDEDRNGVSDGWVPIGAGVFTLDRDAAAYGQHSQKVELNDIPDPIGSFAAIQQRVPISSGSSYELSIDYKYAVAFSPDYARSVGIVVYSLDSNGAFIGGGTFGDWGWNTTGVWKRKSLTLTPPSASAYVLIEFRISVNGSMWLDGALLRKLRS